MALHHRPLSFLPQSHSPSSLMNSLFLPTQSLITSSKFKTFSRQLNCEYANLFRTRALRQQKREQAGDHDVNGDCLDSTSPPYSHSIDEVAGVSEQDFTGTPYVPVYVKLPANIIDMDCELVDPDDLTNHLKILKSAKVDGVKVDCWWAIVESRAPQQYNWSGYKRLFQIVRDLNLKLQVVITFHGCGGNFSDAHIPLPRWVREIGNQNPDIYFTDKEGGRNKECLTWGIDEERVLNGLSAFEVYYDFMRRFRAEFAELFEDETVSDIEIGLGPSGELRYPSYPRHHGWMFPGIGEFQCYDKYLMKSLEKTAEKTVAGRIWNKGPENSGSYNSIPHETRFFCDKGGFETFHGRFFLEWYSQVLIDHGDRMLGVAKFAFAGTPIVAKLPCIHWWYMTASHAAELTAGIYNPQNRDGYSPIVSMLKKHDAALNFACVVSSTLDQFEDFPEALADPISLGWQVLNAAWDGGIQLANENALPCYDRECYNKILKNAKPSSDPEGRHVYAFTYSKLGPTLMESQNFLEFKYFVRRMHGEG